MELGLWRVIGRFLLKSAGLVGTHLRIVKTGKYRPGDESRLGAVPPDEVYESFAAFVDKLLTADDQAQGG